MVYPNGTNGTRNEMENKFIVMPFTHRDKTVVVVEIKDKQADAPNEPIEDQGKRALFKN